MRTAVVLIAAMACLTAGPASAGAQQRELSEPRVRGAAASRVHRYLSWCEQFGFSGVALVALEGEVVLHQAYGPADRGREIPNRLDTVFSFGSIAKQFTAAAVMRLEQRGKLRTEDAISKYLDGVPSDKSGITIHQLLTHTSGLIDYHGISDFQKMDRATAVRVILGKPLLSKPGSEFAYSNSGYTLAAAIVEVVSGRDFMEFMQEEIFRPAGMRETGWMGDDLWEGSRVARIYRGRRDNGSPAEKPGPFWVLLGNGGVVSTVGQMYLWDRALRSDKILSRQAKRKMFTPELNDYGYGWDVLKTDRGTTSHMHDGGSVLGLSAWFVRFVEEDGAFILASNATIGDGLAIDYLAQPASRLIFDDVDPLPEPPKLEARGDQAARYVGRYALAGGGRFVIDSQGGELFFAAAGQDALEAVDARARPHAEMAAALNRLGEKILNDVFSGDLESLKAAFTKTEEPVDRRAARWSRLLKSQSARDGEFRRLELLGTTDIGGDGERELVTWFRLHFESGGRVWRFHWKDGKLRGLGGDAWPYPFFGPLRFTADGDGLVFHFDSARAVGVQFLPPEGDRAASLSVAGEAGVAQARRLGEAESIR